MFGEPRCAIGPVVAFVELGAKVAPRGYAAESCVEPNEGKGDIGLPPEKARSHAAREEVMVVVPFTGDPSGPESIDRQVASIEIDAVAAAIAPAPVEVIIMRPNADGPNGGPAEERRGQSVAARQIEGPVPEGPVQRVVQRGPTGMRDRTPPLVFFVSVDAHAGVANERAEPVIVGAGEVALDRLMELTGEETVQPSPVHVVRVTRSVGQRVMNVVRD